MGSRLGSREVCPQNTQVLRVVVPGGAGARGAQDDKVGVGCLRWTNFAAVEDRLLSDPWVRYRVEHVRQEIHCYVR